jgi:SpoVK/Ycf46/Vps4 family AAA+-type ATPase
MCCLLLTISVKAVFSLARKLSPCVVFIDEVDALFAARQANTGSGSAMAHNQTLTEFMQELDGLSSASANKDKRLVVVGATNRPFALDDAVLRRLPRRVLVDLPGLEDRKGEICEIVRANRQPFSNSCCGKRSLPRMLTWTTLQRRQNPSLVLTFNVSFAVDLR